MDRGEARAWWDTLQVTVVPAGRLEGARMRWEEMERVPSLCCLWLEREPWSAMRTGSVPEGERDNHST